MRVHMLLYVAGDEVVEGGCVQLWVMKLGMGECVCICWVMKLVWVCV